MNQPVQRTVLSGDAASAARASIETASWIWHQDAPRNRTAIVRFDIDFEALDEPLTLHISADQRFQLKLDGMPLARGPDCGDPAHWPFATYQLKLCPGPHRLSAKVWWIGPHAPLAQMTVEGGFILKAEGAYNALLTTGTAPWMVTACPEYSFQPWETEFYQAVGDQLRIDGRLREQNIEYPASVIAIAAHKPVHGLFENKWILAPTSLPEQLSNSRTCGTVRAVLNEGISPEKAIPAETQDQTIQELVDGHASLVIPSHSTRSFICDLEDYVCAFPKFKCSGGADAEISWSWAEALYEKDLVTKTNRKQIAGLHFTGLTDFFVSNGNEGQDFETLWWRAGRYICLSIQTAGEPLTLQSLEIEETRYPLENASRFSCGDPGMEDLIQLCFRGLQANSHEKASDCPYYEQLMYAGDTRIQALIQYITTADDRLPRRCIELFNGSRASGCHGLTTARYPDRDTQWIPPFSLIWIWMVHDYFYWRDDAAFVKEQLAGIRSVLNAFAEFLNTDNLLDTIPHWVFVDWTSDWFEGYPPGGQGGISSIVNLMYIQTLEKAAELETALGNLHFAEAYQEQKNRTAQAVLNTFWNAHRHMMADDVAHTQFSEHAQALTAVYSGFAEETRQDSLRALSNPQNALTKASIYFSFYVFDALLSGNETADIRRRLDAWNELVEQGFKTPPEEFGQSRSDCHAWGSHPLYHFHTGVLGIRPNEPGFHTVSIKPRNIGWEKISGSTVHSKGNIETSFSLMNGVLSGEIILPKGLTGTLEWDSTTINLSAGTNQIEVPKK